MTIARALLLSLAVLLSGALHAAGITLPDASRIEFDNGVVILLSEKHDVPLIGIEAVLRGGGLSDPAGLEGISDLLAGLMGKGAGERDASAFAEAVAAVGGSLDAAAGLETLTVAGEFMSRDAALMVELLADLLRRPALDAAEFDKLRNRSINFIRAAKDSNLRALVPYYGDAFLFGDHPYGRSAVGTEASLARITHADAVRHYREQVGGDRLIISVSGDFETSTMQSLLSNAFSDWRAAEAELANVAAPQPQTGRRVLLVDKPGVTQTYFWLANIGVAVDYPQREELDIANTVFGGRFTSMLNTALRLESGLTYGASSRLTRLAQPGSVAISSYTETSTTTVAIDMAIDVLNTLHAEGIATPLVGSAKSYLLGQFPPRFETAEQLAGAFARLELYGLDLRYYNDYGAAIGSADSAGVGAVIDAVYPTADNLVFVLIGDAEKIRDDVAAYGPVTEMSINDPRFRPE